MIRNQWYAILESKEVGNEPVGVTRMNEKLVLWRVDDGNLNCIYDRCCHRGASLALGCIEKEKIECPFHGFLYDGTGKVVTIPANGRAAAVPDRFKVHAYEVREAYGLIWLWYGDQSKPDKPDIPFFMELNEGFIYKSKKEIWNVHYTRAIENQLDVVHLPFVHNKTIGKGGRTIVNGPVIVWEDNRMTFYVDNVSDDGKKTAIKTADITEYEHMFHLQYQVPNIWQNCISDQVRVFIAFAPIDDENTMLYLRFYQKFLTLPIIGPLVTSLGNIFNLKILHEDRRVVLTQKPKKTELKMDEKLIPGDLPIIEFRKKREKLKSEVN